MTLQQDLTLKQDLTLLSTLDLNGSTLVVLGKLVYGELNHNNGDLINLCCHDQLLTLRAELDRRDEIMFITVGYTEAGQLGDYVVYSFTSEHKVSLCEIELSQWPVLENIKVFTLNQDHVPFIPPYLCYNLE